VADDDSKRDYEVGYGKPPKKSRFAKGQCGNPKGRPKGARNLRTLIEDELNVKVSITENGKRRSISKREAVAKQVVNKAAAGDPKAIPILLNHEQQSGATGGAAAQPELLGAEDQFVMANIIARIRQADGAPSGFTAPQESPAEDEAGPQSEPGDSD
jgi:uncharacterized protein DUF5681